MFRPKKQITQPQNFTPPDMSLAKAINSHSAVSDTGERVSKESMTSSIAWTASLKLISNRIGCVGKPVFQKIPAGRTKLTNHNVYRLINDKANPFTKSIDFFRVLAIDICYGNGYALIRRDEDTFEPMSLYNIDNQCVVPIPEYEDGELVNLYYTINTKNGLRTIPANDMIHVKELPIASDDHGVSGLDIVKAMKNNFSLSSVIEKYTSLFFRQGTHVGRYLKVPNWLDDEQREILKESIVDIHQGLNNAHKLAVLYGDSELVPFEADNSTAQLNETNLLLERQKAVLLGVPGNLVGDRDGLSQYGSMPEMNLGYQVHTLDPLFSNIEAELEHRLLTFEERAEGIYIEFDRNSILKGDPSKSKAELKDEMLSCGVSFEQRLEKNNLMFDEAGTYFMPNGYTPWKPGQIDIDLTTLTTLIQSVASKQLPPDAAKAMIKATYPKLKDQQINDIVNPCIGFEMPKPDPVVIDPVQEEKTNEAPKESEADIQRSENQALRNTIERLRRRSVKSGEIDDFVIDEAFEGIELDRIEAFKRALDPIRDELSSVLKEQRKQVMEDRWNSQELLNTILS